VGDRFVLREAGRRETVAGGVVLDVDPPRRPGADPTTRLAARASATPEELPALVVAERGAGRDSDLRLLTGRSPAVNVARTRSGGWWIAASLLDAVADAMRAHLERFHVEHPLVPGEDVAPARQVAAEAARAAGGPADADLVEALLVALDDRGDLVREGSIVRLPSHRASLEGHEDEVERLLRAVVEGEPTPPTVAELLAAGVHREVVDAAVRAGVLVRVSPELVLTPAFVERALAEVRSAGPAGLTVSAVRERLGTSRKYAVPLLEYLDEQRLTRRTGDVRVAREGP